MAGKQCREPAQCRDINQLKPEARRKCLAIMADCRGHGLSPLLIETQRTATRQLWLWQHERTWVRHSRHQDGEAWDIGFLDAKGKMIWDADAGCWDILAKSAKAHGCIAGHNWKVRDCPHIELP
jgi:hypothetical protein